MNAIRRVHFAELNAKLNTLAVTRVFPKYGTPLLASILREHGYETRIFLEGVSDMRLERIADCDALCLPVYAPIYNKVLDLVRQVRARWPGLPIIAGGPQATLYPDTVVGLCDYAIRGEGDEALPALLQCLSHGQDVKALAGLSFLEGERLVSTPDRTPPIIPPTMPDLTLIDGFDRATRGPSGRFQIVNTLQTSRGCKFSCAFCPTPQLFGGVYRNRDADSIIREIRAKLVYNPVFFVVDNSFLSNRKRTIELLRRLVDEDLGAQFIIFERHEIGRDRELLRLMRRAGVRSIIVGIESLVDENLRIYRKRQSSAEVARSVENILESDIHVIGTFVLGGDGDTKEEASRIVSFVQTTGISLNLFIMHDVHLKEGADVLVPLRRRFVTHYRRHAPGNTDYYDYATGNFVTYFPKRVRPSTLQESLLSVYEQVYTHGNIARRVLSPNVFGSLFGVNHGYAMLRTTKILRAIANEGYMRHLERLEQGLYDAEEHLDEEALADLDGLPLPPPLRPHIDQHSYRTLMRVMSIPGLVRAARQRRQSLRPARKGRSGATEPAEERLY